MRRRRGGGAGTVAFAYSDSGATHWLTHDAQTGSSPTQDQRAPFGYVVASPADRIVNIEGRSKYLNVTRLETVQLNAAGKSVTWKFDTFGTRPFFSLTTVIPGYNSVTVYVAESPMYQGG